MMSIDVHVVSNSVEQTVDDGRKGAIVWEVPAERRGEFRIGRDGLFDL